MEHNLFQSKVTIQFTVFYFWITVIHLSGCARILGIVPSPYFSHQQVFQPIWKELSLRGHQVTTITTHPIKDLQLINLTEIQLPFVSETMYTYLRNAMDRSFFGMLMKVTEAKAETGRHVLSNSKIQNFLQSSDETKFDVVLAELSVLSTLAFAKRFKAPLIAISSMDTTCNLQNLMGNPIHPLFYPDNYYPVEDNPSFFGRLQIIYFTLTMTIVYNLYIMPSQQLLVDQYFGPDYSLSNIVTDISLLLVNSDPIFHKVKPLVPTVVQIGSGSHRRASKPLPTKLKQSLDAAENGFIYFSSGSIFKSSGDISNQTLNVIVKTFSELPYTVLWKFEDDYFLNQPKNVITSKWFPQQDVLKHPKILLFITHCGLQSMDEAIYDHVPMIGMPLFLDQFFNAKKMVSKGFGLSVDHTTLTKEEFKAAILEVTNNPKYRNKIKELAKLALDQPMTGTEKAVWWTEYVIRYNGTKHLRSPILDIPLYQYYMVDVAVVLILLLFALLGIVLFSLKISIRAFKKLTVGKIKQK